MIVVADKGGSIYTYINGDSWWYSKVLNYWSEGPFDNIDRYVDINRECREYYI